MSHSPEPWSWSSPHLDPNPHEILVDAQGRTVLEAEYGMPGLGKYAAICGTQENRERIVACVNACRGISTEDLLKYPVLVDSFDRENYG